MNGMEKQSESWEDQRTQADREELVELIRRAIPADGKAEPIAGLILQRASAPGEPLHVVTAPSFCVIAQGSKEIILRNESYTYDPFHYLLVTAELPLTGTIREASPEHPYLSLRLILEPALVHSVMVEVRNAATEFTNIKAITVSSLCGDLLNAVVRLARLIARPSEAPFMAPIIKREIVYRLWMEGQGDRLRHIAAHGGFVSPIARAITLLRKKFDQPLRIEKIAQECGMSVSSFHHHFKSVTSMTPLQFQKQLRLQEARRLMLHEHLDAAEAGFRVGYDDASHFNRDYKRHFGMPPRRDVERLRLVPPSRVEQY